MRLWLKDKNKKLKGELGTSVKVEHLPSTEAPRFNPCTTATRKRFHWDWRHNTAQQLRTLVALPKTRGSIHSIHMESDIIFNFSSKGYGTLFWLLQALHTCGTQACVQAKHPYLQNHKKSKGQRNFLNALKLGVVVMPLISALRREVVSSRLPLITRGLQSYKSNIVKPCLKTKFKHKIKRLRETEPGVSTI